MLGFRLALLGNSGAWLQEWMPHSGHHGPVAMPPQDRGSDGSHCWCSLRASCLIMYCLI